MVLSCSLRDFLFPLGMEIRLGLWKRIFYFSFLPLLFSHVLCPEWPFRKSNLDFFFFLPDNAVFFFTIWCNTEQRCLSNGFSKRRNLERPFFRLKGGENLGFESPPCFDPVQQKFNFAMKTYYWTLAAFSDIQMDNYQSDDWWIFMEEQLWLEFSLLSWLLYKSSLLHLEKFRRQSRVTYRLSHLTLSDWYARLA